MAELTKGNLYASNFFYYLEKGSSKELFSKEEILYAIKRAIEESNPKDAFLGVKE